MKPGTADEREHTELQYKASIEALRKIESLYQTLMETSPDAVVLSDQDGIIIMLNRQLAQLHGHEREQDLIGTCAFELFAPEERQRALDNMRKGMEANPEGRGKFECLLLRKDGTRFWGELYAKLVLLPEGKFPFMLTIVRDVTERKTAEEVIRASLHEKEVLLKEVYHRVKNNMQVIVSLFNLQITHTTNEECRQILKESKNRLRAMSLVHDKLYRSHDLARIDLASYIQDLTIRLFAAFLVDSNQVSLEMNLDEKLFLDINSAVPCGLILNELISNALQHAFPDGRRGMIRIDSKRASDGAVVLLVADNGIGLSCNIDFRHPESFGLQIVNMLVGQLGGTLELTRQSGTAFSVTFR